jgi:hypothetical protein
LISFSGDHRGARTVGVVPDGVTHVRFVPKAGTPTQVEVTGNFFNLYAPSEPTARRIEPPTGWAGPRGKAGLIERPPMQPLGHLEWLDAQGAVIGPKQP